MDNNKKFTFINQKENQKKRPIKASQINSARPRIKSDSALQRPPLKDVKNANALLLSKIPTIKINDNIVFNSTNKNDACSGVPAKDSATPLLYDQKQRKRAVTETFDLDEVLPSLNTRHVTIRKRVLSPFDEEVFVEDEVFVEAEDYFNLKRFNKKHFNTDISPIKKHETRREMMMRAPLVRRRSLSHGICLKNSKESVYNDPYTMEYLEDNISSYLARDRNYLSKLNELTIEEIKVRSNTLNWLLKLQNQYEIPIQIYFQTVRLFDSVLSFVEVSASMYQLVAITMFWIMNKFDNNVTITAKLIASWTSRAYTEEEIVKMEKKLLRFMKYNCVVPEPSLYIEYWLMRTDRKNGRFHDCCYYLMESFVLSPKFSSYPSALIAVAIYSVASHFLNKTTTKHTAAPFNSYEKEQLYAAKNDILQNLLSIPSDAVCNAKYSDGEKNFISKYIRDALNAP